MTAAREFPLQIAGALVAGLSLVTSAAAITPDRHVSQYGHRSWRFEDYGITGKPATALTQSADGYLWLGSESGLWRFDGARFVSPTFTGSESLPSTRVNSLLSTPEGDLWIGTTRGLARFNSGGLKIYQNIPESISALAEAPDGAIWFGLSGPSQHKEYTLCRLAGESLRCYGQADGLRTAGVEHILVLANSDVWLGSDVMLQRWAVGSTGMVYEFPDLKKNAGQLGITGVVQSHDGSIWVSKCPQLPGPVLVKIVNGIEASHQPQDPNLNELRCAQLFQDRAGALWLGTFEDGLFRLYNGKVDHFGVADGLSGEQVHSIFEDREGTLWVATNNGLDSFYDTRVVRFSRRDGITSSEVDGVQASRGHAVFVGTAAGLDVLNTENGSINVDSKVGRTQIEGMFEDHEGRLWVGVDDDLYVETRDQVSRVSGPDGRSLGMIFQLTEDGAGDLWATSLKGTDRELIWIHEGHVKRLFSEDEVPVVRSLAGDPKGGVWLGLRNGDLAHFDGHDLKTFAYPHDDKAEGRRIILTADNTVLGATSYGLIGLRNGIKRVLDIGHGLPCGHLFAIAADRDGDLWVAAECGLIEIPVDQYREWWSGSEKRIAVRVLDSADGLQPGLAPFGSATRSSDGRLWFANGRILELLDPTRLDGNTVPPPVQIEQIFADHTAYAPDSRVRLPALTRDIEIDYTALSLVAPEKVRFQYLLEGHDKDWIDAGRRRQVFYNDLAPGTYTFRVIASNNNDVWNRIGASESFIIEPALYQTTWFRGLVVMLAICGLWILYLMRLRRVTAVVQARLDERLMERERIARELHDTLLQGFQGLLLRFHAVLKQLSNPDISRPMLEAALDRAEDVLRESRSRLGELRPEKSDPEELSRILEEFGKSFGDRAAAQFSATLEGEPRALKSTAKLALVRIGRESIANAFLHAAAARIEARVIYARSGLQLIVSDDGKGISPEIIESGVPGHWGLANIREDARKLTAIIVIQSPVGGGTNVRLSVAGRYIYADSPDAGLWNRLSRWYVRRAKNRGEDSRE